MKNVTIITGACGGLGKAFCREVARQGDDLIITGTNLERTKANAEELMQEFPELNVKFFKLDLSVEQERDDFFKWLENEGEGVHRLINNAGYIAEGGLLEFDDETVKKVIRVNCEGTVDLTQKFIKCYKDNLEILTVSSLGAFYPMPYMSIYSSTKRMLEGLMVALRYEVKDQNIKVSTLCPGGIPTTQAMIDAIKTQGVSGKLSAKTPEYIAKYALKKLKKNKAIIIPGAFNRFLYFTGKLAGETFTAKVVGRRWLKANKKREVK
ncbi:MAG: SDR family oxidoreductase [Clostridia bacterium]|nr:SDR family oxidoreductase [Clostridia bacterium]